MFNCSTGGTSFVIDNLGTPAFNRQYKSVSAGRPGTWVTTLQDHVKYRGYEHKGNTSYENWQTVSGISMSNKWWIC